MGDGRGGGGRSAAGRHGDDLILHHRRAGVWRWRRDVTTASSAGGKADEDREHYDSAADKVQTATPQLNAQQEQTDTENNHAKRIARRAPVLEIITTERHDGTGRSGGDGEHRGAAAGYGGHVEDARTFGGKPTARKTRHAAETIGTGDGQCGRSGLARAGYTDRRGRGGYREVRLESDVDRNCRGRGGSVVRNSRVFCSDAIHASGQRVRGYRCSGV